YPLECAESLFYLGRLHYELENNDLAMECLSQALEIQNAKLGLKHPTVHATMAYLTRVYVRLRRYKDSEEYLNLLLKELQDRPEPDYPALVEANLDMGLVRLEQGR
ncbi:unnamed protein product, partial [Phaeothamnion confervicola]